MRTLPAADPATLREAVHALDDRALVVLPTGASYAVAADALDEDAVLEAFRATGREADLALPVCVQGVEDVANVATLTPLARGLAERFWPGPVSLVLRAKPWLPDALTAGGTTVAVRAPASAFARRLAGRFGPFTMTTATRAGEPPARDVAEARERFGGAIRLYVDDGPLVGDVATVVDCTGDTPRVLREGAVAAAEVAPLGS